MGHSKQQIAAIIANRMTLGLMELTQLSWEDCQNILTKQLSNNANASIQFILELDERNYISNFFH